jgi:hypothetical protein
MFYQAQIAGGKKTRPALVFQEKHAKSLFLFNQDNLSFYSYFLHSINDSAVKIVVKL